MSGLYSDEPHKFVLLQWYYTKDTNLNCLAFQCQNLTGGKRKEDLFEHFRINFEINLFYLEISN